MHAKVTLYETYNWDNHEILILIELGRKAKQWHKEYEKYQVAPKVVRRSIKNCSLKFRNIHRKATVLESSF